MITLGVAAKYGSVTSPPQAGSGMVLDEKDTSAE
jgi:hypothetical protein